MTALFCTPTQDYYSSHIRLTDSFFALCGVIKKEIKFERFCKCTVWKKKPLPKIGLLVQIGGETWLPLYYDESVQIFLKLDWIVTVTIHVYFRRTYMESSENNATYISPPICTNRLILTKRKRFILFFLDMPTFPMISQNLVFVTLWLLFSIRLQQLFLKRS